MMIFSYDLLLLYLDQTLNFSNIVSEIIQDYRLKLHTL